MKRSIVLLIVVCFTSLLTFVSCKSKAAVVDIIKPETHVKSSNVIENYSNNKTNFSTLNIKSNVQYADDKQTQNVTAEIKIKKDEQILVSIRFLGITMAKALITPTKVSYYEKINGSYFEGDFSALSQWLGTDLDFNKIQNMLLGRAIDELKNGKYTESLADQTYRLDDASGNNTKKSFFLDADKFFVKKQEITQTAEGRMIQVTYANEVFYKEATMPTSVIIKTFQKNSKSEINLDYNTISFNEELSFPYSVPNGYKRILIK
ncbi:DUF4292 domain-containing protein [Flavobacterium sp.]|uniref:DUF4292 domain-containing protein n=1 Tax=Flavobacterium sp. TaxID=239 RepID=UPI0037A1634B